MAHAFQSNGNRPFEAPTFVRNSGITNNFDTVVVSGFSRHVTPKQIVDFFTLKEGACVCISTKSDPPSVLLRFTSPVVAQKVLVRYNNADLHGQKLKVLPPSSWHSTIPETALQSTNIPALMQNNACLPTPIILPRPMQIPPSLSHMRPMASILNWAKTLHLIQMNNLQRYAFLQGNTQTSLPLRNLPLNNRQQKCDKGSSVEANKCLGNGSKNADQSCPRTGNPNDERTVEKAQETAQEEVDIRKCPKNQSDKKNLEVKGPVIRRKRLRKRQKDVDVGNSKRPRTAVVYKTSLEVMYSGDQNMEKSDEMSLQKARKVTKNDGNSLASDNDKDKLDTKTKTKKDEASTDSLENKSTTKSQCSKNQGIGDKKKSLSSGDDTKDRREGGNKTIQKDSILENENPADCSKKYNEESHQVSQRISNGESPTRKNDEKIHVKECYHTLASKDLVMNDNSKNSVWSEQKESKESLMSFENENNSVVTKGSNNVAGEKLEHKSEKMDSIPRNLNAGDGVDNKGKKTERSTASFAKSKKFLSKTSGEKAGVDTKKADEKDTANNLVIERKSVNIDIESKNEEGKCRELTQESAVEKVVKQSGSGSNNGDIIKKSDPNDSASGSKSGNPLQGVDRDEKYLTSGSNNNKTGEFGKNETKRFATIGELKPVQKDSETNVKKCACHDNKKTGCCSEFRAPASNSESKKKDLTSDINDTQGKCVTVSTNDNRVQGNAKEGDVRTKSDGAENLDLIFCVNSKNSLGKLQSNFDIKAPTNEEKRNEETSSKIGSAQKKSANSSKSLIEHNANNSNAKNRTQSTNHLQDVANGKNSPLENKHNGRHGQEKKPGLEKSFAKAPSRVNKANNAKKVRQGNDNLPASSQSDVTQKNLTSPAKEQISLNDSRQLSASRNAESGKKTSPKSSLSKEDAARTNNKYYRFLSNTRNWKYAGLARNCERDRIRFRRRLDRSPPRRLRSFSPHRKRVSPPRIKGGRMFERSRSPDRTCLRNKPARNAADVATRKRPFEATGLVVAPPKKKRLDTKSTERNNESRDLPQPLMSIDLSTNSKIVPKKVMGCSPWPPTKKVCLDDNSVERINKTKSTDGNRSIETGSTDNTECPKKVGSANKLDTKQVVGTSFKATGLVAAPPKRKCLDKKRTVINKGKVFMKRAVKSNDLRNVLLEKNNGKRYGKGQNILGDNTRKESDGVRCDKASDASDVSTSKAQKDKDFSLVTKTSYCFTLNNEKFAGGTAKTLNSLTDSAKEKVITPKASAKDTTHKNGDSLNICSTSSLEQSIQKKLHVSSLGELESGSLKRCESINSISTPNIPGETSVEKNCKNQNTSPTEGGNKIKESHNFAKESIVGNSTSSKITISPFSTDLSNENNFSVECDHTEGDNANTDGDTDTRKNSLTIDIAQENNGTPKCFSSSTVDLRDNVQKDVDMRVGDEDQMLVENVFQERNNLKENLEENSCDVNQFSRSVAGFSTVIAFKASSVLTENEESENESRNQSDSLTVPKISNEDSLKKNRAWEIPEQLETVAKPILSKKTSLSDKKTIGLGKSKIILAKLKSLKINAQETLKNLSKVSVTTNSESCSSHVDEKSLTVPKHTCENKSVDVESANNMYRPIDKVENSEVFQQNNTSKIVCDKQHVTEQYKIECTALETKSSPTCDEILEKSTASTIAPAFSVVKDLKKYEVKNLQSTEDQRLCVTKAEDSNKGEENIDAASVSILWDKTRTAVIADVKQETQLWNEPFSAKDDLTIQSISSENNHGTEITNATCDAVSTEDSGPWEINSSFFSTTMGNGSDVEEVKTIKLEQTSPPNEKLEERDSSVFGGPNDEAITYKTTSSSEALPLRTASAILSGVKTVVTANVEETLTKDGERFSADYEQFKCDFRRICNNLRNLNNSVLTNNANSKASVTASTMSDYGQGSIVTSASSVPTEDMNSNTPKSENKEHYSQPSDDSTRKNLIHVSGETEFSKRIPNTVDSNKELLDESEAVLTKCDGGSTVEAPEGLDSMETKLVPAAVETSGINGNESKDRLIEDSRQDVLRKSQNDICGDNEEPLNWEDVLNETAEFESLTDFSSESLLDFASIDKIQMPVGIDDHDETRRNSIENDGQDVNDSNSPRNISIAGEKRKRNDEPAEVAGSKHQKCLTQSQDDSLYDAQNNDSNRGTNVVNGLSDVERNREKQERCFILKNILALEEQYERETTALLNNVKMLASMDPSLTEKLKVAFEDCLAKIGQGCISKLYELNQKKENYMNKQNCAQANNSPPNKPKCKNQRTAKGKIRNRKRKDKRTALKNAFDKKGKSTAQEETTSQQRIGVSITPQNKQQYLSLGETSSQPKIGEGKAPQSKPNHKQEKGKRSKEFVHQSTKGVSGNGQTVNQHLLGTEMSQEPTSMQVPAP